MPKLEPLSKWKKIKRSGAFRKKVKQNYKNILCSGSSGVQNICVKDCDVKTNVQEQQSVADNRTFEDDESVTNEEVQEDRDIQSEDWLGDAVEFNEEIHTDIAEVEKNVEFRKAIRSWAVSFNVPHLTLKALFENINNRFPSILPRDPRTLLKTYQTVIIIKVGNGNYWHHGFEKSLRQIFAQVPEILIPKIISCNINMDGLPIYKSSKLEFWPILFNIPELPLLKPMVIGIYCG